MIHFDLPLLVSLINLLTQVISFLGDTHRLASDLGDLLQAIGDAATAGLALPEMVAANGLHLTANQRLVASLVLDSVGLYVPTVWLSNYARDVFRQRVLEVAADGFRMVRRLEMRNKYRQLLRRPPIAVASEVEHFIRQRVTDAFGPPPLHRGYI